MAKINQMTNRQIKAQQKREADIQRKIEFDIRFSERKRAQEAALAEVEKARLLGVLQGINASLVPDEVMVTGGFKSSGTVNQFFISMGDLKLAATTAAKLLNYVITKT